MRSTFDFLNAVWPDAGYFCLSLELPGDKMRQEVFDTVEQAAACADHYRHKGGVHFSTHSLKERQIWNERREKFQVRNKLNMMAARSFYFDLDVKPGSNDPSHYQSVPQAIAAVGDFCAATGLPLPMFVNSGHGVHIYWIMDRDILSADWAGYAGLLKLVAQAKGLKHDPQRTDGVVSLMRAAETINHKPDRPPVPTRVERGADPIDAEWFIAKLRELVQVDGIIGGNQDIDLGDNTRSVFDGPSVGLEALLRACGQVREVGKTRGNCPRAQWLQMVGTLRHVENGRDLAHKFSSGYPQYDPHEVDDLLDNAEDEDIGPTTCAVWEAVGDRSLCAACQHHGHARNPLHAARRLQQTDEPTNPMSVSLPDPVPVVEICAEGDSQPPPLPAGFVATERGVAYKHIREDNVTLIPVIDGVLYPRFRQHNAHEKIDQHEWYCHLPNERPKTFLLDSHILQDLYTLRKVMASHGVYFTGASEKWGKEYMILYIKTLQQMQAPVDLRTHLGWTDERSVFVMPDKTLSVEGPVTPTRMSDGVRDQVVSTRKIGKAGTLERQRELLRMFEGNRFLPVQFYILCSLASPLFHMTGYHGSIIHLVGKPQSGKSYALSCAMSLWGHPEKMPVVGLGKSSTVVGRDTLANMFGSYPFGMDEITTVAEDVLREFALFVSQADRGKLRGTRDAKLRKMNLDAQDNLILTTGNIDLYRLLVAGDMTGDAAVARIFQIEMPQLPHNDPDASIRANAMLSELVENYGHIGERVMEYVIANMPVVRVRILEKMNLILREGKLHSGFRFYPAIAAAALVAGELARELGLLDYDTDAIYQWVLHSQFRRMMSAFVNAQESSAQLLTSYLSSVAADATVVMSDTGSVPLREPRGFLKARFERGTNTFYVVRDDFRAYCRKRGINEAACLDDLRTAGIVARQDERKLLTLGTTLPALRTWCHVIDMNHEDMVGEVIREAAEGRNNLRVISGGVGGLK